MTMGFCYTNGAMIEGKPISDGLTEKILFAPGIPAPTKLKALQIKYMFPETFTYKQIEQRFDVSRRTAYRYIEKIRDIGLIKKVQVVPMAKYKFNENFR